MPAKTMQSKNKDVLREMVKTISPVLAINNPSLRPYIEIFEYHPENIVQQPLGSLVGFFEIKDYSDDSAYVVNFLTSVLKKEYYANPKRSVTESFDSALQKVNVALSEVVKHGNMGWLGHIDGAVCILEKNSLHLSVTGSAQVLLSRGNLLADISEDLAPEKDAPNPLKTFVNVSSGRMESGDKILITSSDIFHLFSLEELQRNIQRFEKEKFVQFLKTALSNELEMAGTIVVDFDEPSVVKAPRRTPAPVKKEAALNAFSSSAFAKENPLEKISETAAAEEEKADEEEKTAYTDKKTGHIYITGEEQQPEKTSSLAPHLLIAKEHLLDHAASLGKALRRSSKRSWKTVRQASTDISERFRKATQEIKSRQEAKREAQKEALLALQKEQDLEISAMQAKEKEAALSEPIRKETQTVPRSAPLREPQMQDAAERIAPIARAKDPQDHPGRQDHPLKKEILAEAPRYSLGNFLATVRPRLQSGAFLAKNILREASLLRKKIAASGLSRLFPNFSAISKRFSSLPYQGKIFSLLALALIIFGPLIISKFSFEKTRQPAITQIVEQADPLDTLKGDKGMRKASSRKIIPLSDSSQILLSDIAPLIISSGQVGILSGAKLDAYPFPQGSGQALQSVYMDDLDLALILTDMGKVISFSPISRQYKENAINLPPSYKESLLGTYLTYLYVLDEEAGQIYRYPRAEGGFGEKTNWLREPLPFPEISAMTLDDSIYLSDGSALAKFFRGQKEDLSFESSLTPVRISALYARPEDAGLYALDTANSRIVSYAKTDGKIMAQYFNPELAEAASFIVDEKNRTAYFATEKDLFSISLD